MRRTGHMNRPVPLLHSRPVNWMVRMLMGALWGLFAYRHVTAFGNTGNWMYLPFCFSETLTAGFFLFRTMPVSVSNDVLDWVFALGGTFAPLFLVPSSSGVLPSAQ